MGRLRSEEVGYGGGWAVEKSDMGEVGQWISWIWGRLGSGEVKYGGSLAVERLDMGEVGQWRG